MLVRTLVTVLLQIFCKSFFISKVIVKGMKDPDNNFKSNSLSINGLKWSCAIVEEAGVSDYNANTVNNNFTSKKCWHIWRIWNLEVRISLHLLQLRLIRD